MTTQDFSKYFNPAVTNLDFFITVDIPTAEKSGWDFTGLYEDAQSASGESYEKARKRVRKEWSIEVKIYGEKTKPSVLYCIKSFHNGNWEHSDLMDTGDAEKTIQDVIYWLENDKEEQVRDESWGENYTSQPAFAQFNTQAA